MNRKSNKYMQLQDELWAKCAILKNTRKSYYLFQNNPFVLNAISNANSQLQELMRKSNKHMHLQKKLGRKWRLKNQRKSFFLFQNNPFFLKAVCDRAKIVHCY